MPRRVEPCLALLKPKPPVGDQWSYEIKWDGWRLAIHVEPQGVRILTKGGHDWTNRFPAIAEAARELGASSAILDGEAVVFDSLGRSDFNLLQQSLGGRGGKRPAGEASFMAFDLLYLNGHDFRGLELEERRQLLAALIPDDNPMMRFSEDIEGEPGRIFATACAHGLEGIIAKDRDSFYRPGRLGDWLKIKCVQSDGFAIVGYEPSMGAYGGIGSLLLAGLKGGKLTYAGSVGTGFKEREANRLRAMLDKIKRKAPPIAYHGKRRVVWVSPTLVAEIAYRGWTGDNKLRHSSYKGLRDPDDDSSVYDFEGQG